MTCRNDVIQEARTWLGTRWMHHGRNRQGVDCAGLISLVGSSLGLSSYDFLGYDRRSFDHTFLKHFTGPGGMEQKPIEDARPGDAVAFADSKYPCHVAIIGSRNGVDTIIHAYSFRRKVVEEIYTDEWKAKTCACFQYFGLSD